MPNGIVHETASRLRAEGLALIDGLGPALTATSRMMAWRDHRPPAAMTPPPGPGSDVVARWRERLVGGAPLDEAEGLALAGEFGIGVPEASVVGSADAALDAARGLSWPLVLKTAMPGVHHKSDVGGVHLGIRDEDELVDAWENMARRHGPRCVVASMVPAGVEMVFGLVRDAQFGPMVLVGAGGVLAEILDDSVLAMPPFDAAFARSLIDRLRMRGLLDGVRGRPACDIDALCHALANFSVLADTLGSHIAELDLNPVVVGPRGVTAVDALVVPQSP